MNAAAGTVYLVGAGPGDPELITVRGLRLLRQADVVIHDRLVEGALLSYVKLEAEIISAAEMATDHRVRQDKINALLLERARSGRVVVRLKGGDPFIFGRGYEELTACREAGVACVVVPGVSSALAAPAAVGVPLTDRRFVRSIAIMTAQTARDSEAPQPDYRALAAMDTVIIMMGREKLAEVARLLIEAGCDPATPAACVEQATLPQQRVVSATVATIAEAADQEKLRAPVVTIVGQVAALADVAAWTQRQALSENIP